MICGKCHDEICVGGLGCAQELKKPGSLRPITPILPGPGWVIPTRPATDVDLAAAERAAGMDLQNAVDAFCAAPSSENIGNVVGAMGAFQTAWMNGRTR